MPQRIYSFHLAQLGVLGVGRALLQPPRAARNPGLLHAECLAPMRLGAPILAPWRWRLGTLALFASWRDEEDLERFLGGTRLGERLSAGWHVRLEFLRRWGRVAALEGLPAQARETDPDEPVVALTLARLRLLEVPRFLRWGKPVERLVRDHPGQTLALAAARPWRTIATFSVWRSAKEMLDMVGGRSEGVSGRRRHVDAMAERSRRGFHSEFTTLRFSCRSEHGTWEGREGIVPL